MLKPSEFIRRFQESVVSLETDLEQETDENHSNVLVLGLPRSGTTLLTQLLHSCTNLYCTNNLIARFWEAPLVGAYLSKLTVGSVKSSSFESFYGRTSDISEPHEFSWFWHGLLEVDDVTNYDPQAASERIDWERVRSKLINLNSVLGGGLVHKPLELVGYHLSHFSRILKKAIFVFIERDPLDMAYSIAEARQRNNEDMQSWWGSYPPAGIYNQIKGDPWDLQIVKQIRYFKQMYAKQLATLPSESLVKTSYQELCQNPVGLLNQVKHCALELGGEISITEDPEPFAPRNKQRDSSLYDSLRAAFASEAPELLS